MSNPTLNERLSGLVEQLAATVATYKAQSDDALALLTHDLAQLQAALAELPGGEVPGADLAARVTALETALQEVQAALAALPSGGTADLSGVLSRLDALEARPVGGGAPAPVVALFRSKADYDAQRAQTPDALAGQRALILTDGSSTVSLNPQLPTHAGYLDHDGVRVYYLSGAAWQTGPLFVVRADGTQVPLTFTGTYDTPGAYEVANGPGAVFIGVPEADATADNVLRAVPAQLATPGVYVDGALVEAPTLGATLYCATLPAALHGSAHTAAGFNDDLYVNLTVRGWVVAPTARDLASILDTLSGNVQDLNARVLQVQYDATRQLVFAPAAEVADGTRAAFSPSLGLNVIQTTNGTSVTPFVAGRKVPEGLYSATFAQQAGYVTYTVTLTTPPAAGERVEFQVFGILTLDPNQSF